VPEPALPKPVVQRFARMHVRDATDADWPAIWPFLHEIVAAGDTFSYDQGMDEAQARAMWLLDSPDRTTVAVEDGAILGSANMYPNHDGPGAHVASGNFMVDSGQRGRGVGRALAEDMIEWARRRGFRAIQFNAVAESNGPAIALYGSFGFETLATIPEGFLHPQQGYVGLLVMFRRLS
jgi:GNAT superfamily N-acetyltransferase